MTSDEFDFSGFYKKLLDQGVPREEIERVHRKLTDRGYKGRSAPGNEDGSGTDLFDYDRTRPAVGKTEQNRAAAVEHENFLKHPPADWGPELDPYIRRKINKWAFRHGLKVTRLPERLLDILSVPFPSIKDYANEEFIEYLVSRKGYQNCNPYKYSLADNLDALRHTSSWFIRSKDVKEAFKKRDPFGFIFLMQFAVKNKQLQEAFAFLEEKHRRGRKIEIGELARITRDVYRLILITGRVEQKKIEEIFLLLKELNQMFYRTKDMPEQVEEAELLFKIAFRNLSGYKHELYPVLLKLINRFYEESADSDEKRQVIHDFLKLNDTDLLNYQEFIRRRRKQKEKMLLDMQRQEIERLETEKKEQVHIRFEGILSILEAMFRGSGIKKIDLQSFVLPYFYIRLFQGKRENTLRMIDVGSVSGNDPVGLVWVFYELIDDLLDAVNIEALDDVLKRESISDKFHAIKERWIEAYSLYFQPYFRSMSDYIFTAEQNRQIPENALKPAGDEEGKKKIFDLRKQILSEDYKKRTAGQVPFYETATELNTLLAAVGRELNLEIIRFDNPITKMLYKRLERKSIVHFHIAEKALYPGYKLVLKQIRKYIEAKYVSRIESIPVLSQIVFLNILRGIVDLLTYLLTSERSFLRKNSTELRISGEFERYKWQAEQDNIEKTNESLRVQLNDDLHKEYADELTGLKNKNYFLKELPAEFDRYKKHSGTVTLIMMDIDHFKWINDSLGHPRGDEVLRAAGKLLNDNIRNIDLAIRFGGEEFLIIVPGKLHTGVILGERLRHIQEQLINSGAEYRDIKALMDDKGEPCGMFSAGIAEAEKNLDLMAAIERVDKVLYQAKKERNKVMVFDDLRSSKDKISAITYSQWAALIKKRTGGSTS